MKMPWLAICILLGICACRTSKSSGLSESLETSNSGDWQSFETAWQQFDSERSSHYPYELQDRCQPIFAKPKLDANAHMNPKGVALFFHGFTACPMQFQPLVEAMQARGYYVIVPLLPGQGRGPTPLKPAAVIRETDGRLVSFGEYYGRYLPQTKEEYESYVDRFNAMIAKAPGRHVVSGLSGGGALAIQAVLRAKEKQYGELYDEVLSLSGFFGIPKLQLGDIPDGLLPEEIYKALLNFSSENLYQIEEKLAAELLPQNRLGQLPLSFGPLCYASICGDRFPECPGSSRTLEAKGGRDAICDIQLNSVAALQSQGLSLRERFRNLKSHTWQRTRIQLVGAEFDPIVNPDLIVQIGQIIGEKLADRSHTCLYRPYKGVKVPHVIFDLTEQPFAPMPWRKSFLDQAIQFLDGGAAFSQNEGEQFVSCAVPYE